MLNWDNSIFEKMGEKAKSECLEVEKWLLKYPSLSSSLISQISESHPALWFSHFFDLLTLKIKEKDLNSIKLGCRFIIDDPKSPFGKINKQKIIRALKNVYYLISSPEQAQIKAVIHKFECKSYKPQEYRELLKLISKMEDGVDLSYKICAKN